MSEHKAVPNIRFNGFEDKWKLSKLGNDLISIHTGTNLLGSETPGGIPLIKMGNLKNGFFDFSKLDYLPICENVKNEDKVRFGDFLFNTRNTLDLVGKGATWMYESTKFAYNNNIAKFNFQNSINTVFFNYLYNTYNVMKQVHARATGTTSVAAIYPKSLDSIIYNLPSKQEQQKIGNFFAKLDKLLDLQQQKIDKLDLLKKTLLQKLFPKHDAKIPELRYREFEDNWIIYSFSGLLIKNSSKNKNLEVKNIESISNKNGFTKQSEQFDGYRVASLDLSNYYVIKGNQFAYNPSRINVGSIAYKRKGEEDSIISPLYVSFSTKNNINDTFLWYWFRTSSFKKQRIQFSEGGVRDTLPFENLKKMRIKLPRLNEQQKIGNLLSKVDALIELENKKLQNLQQAKKCLLQNMFVE